MANLIQRAAQELGLEKSFDIVLKQRKKPNDKNTAVYWGLFRKGKLQSHLIHVYLENFKAQGERDLNTVLVHELIHAWQEENGYTDVHGASFRKMAKRMQAKFPGLKSKLYDSKIDKP